MAFILWITCCSTLVGLAVISVWLVTRQRNQIHPPDSHSEHITVLKPLCGADDSLEDNLETFFEQDHPSFELVFGVQGQTDPAIPVVRRLMARHPRVRAKLVIHEGGQALNPKVANLRATLREVDNDLIVISDSNVAVRPDYLSAMQAELSRPGVGLVTSPIAGVGERSLGATLENLQLNGTISGSVAASALLGHTLVVGKSMMFHRSNFEKLGGFGAVSNLLAEDYVIGRMFRQAGLGVAVCPQPILNVVQTGTLKTFFSRHLRWAMLRTRLKTLIYPAEVLANPMLGAVLTPFLGMGAWPLILGAALSMARDGLCWLRLRGPSGMLTALPLSPIKDLIGLAIWAVAPFRRHVGWRGKRLRLSAGSLLYAEAPQTED